MGYIDYSLFGQLTTTMHRRKYQQLKAYSKIIKYKKTSGTAEEVEMASEEKPEAQQEEGAQEGEAVDEHEEPLKNEDFEDPIEDEFEEEEGWISQSESEQQAQEEVNESGTMMSEPKHKEGMAHQGPRKGEMKEEGASGKPEVFMGNNKELSKGEVLEFDNKAYDMLHRLNVEWPSMSIDFIAKGSPFDAALTPYTAMTQYPYEVFTVQGTCNNTNKNSIIFMKWSNLCQTKYDDDPEGNEENDEEPDVVIQEFETTYDINRIRTLNNSPIVAYWNDSGANGEVRIMDLSAGMEKLKNGVGSKRREKCKEIVIPFECSGYGLAWNPHKVGELVAGDNQGRVSVLANNANYTSWAKTSEYSYHTGSVEDIIFSPEQAYVFASCSSDGTLQLVDMRANNYKKSQLRINAHKKDVNVCDWNKVASHLIVTGSDDCTVKVWDLRMVAEGGDEEVLSFNWHTEPITSIRFQPNEESVIAVASEDNRLSIWDMSVENEEGDPEVPNELLFLHQGQEEIKEICFHPVYYEMMVSTSLDAINILKPSLEMPDICEDERADEEDLKRPPVREEDLDKYLERLSLE